MVSVVWSVVCVVVAVVVVVVCVWHAENPVCGFKASPCMPAPLRAHVLS